MEDRRPARASFWQRPSGLLALNENTVSTTCGREAGTSDRSRKHEPEVHTLRLNTTTCRSELWQSSRDGQRWRLVQADTTALDMEECGLSEGLSARIRREPIVRLEDFAPPLSNDSEGVNRDFPPDTTDEDDWERFSVPLASVPRMGVEMFYWWSAAPQWTVSGPAWLVDSTSGTRRVLCAPQPDGSKYDEHSSLWIGEACGLLLVYYFGDPTRVVDARTGRDVGCLPKSASSAMVTPRLRP